MSWIAAQWQAVAAQGWAAIFIVALVCCSVFLGSAALIFLSISKWRQPANPSIKEDIDKPRPPAATVEQPAVSIKRGLYVGQILASFNKLKEDYVVELGILAYNGTGEAISLFGITGTITFDIQDTHEPLPPAVLVDRGQRTKGVPSFTEMLFVLEQRIPSQLALKLLTAFDEGGGGAFDLRQLNILFSLDSSQYETERLPVFSIHFTKQETIAQGRIVYGAARI